MAIVYCPYCPDCVLRYDPVARVFYCLECEHEEHISLPTRKRTIGRSETRKVRQLV